MDDDHTRIEWQELRGDNLFLVIAEKRAGKWEFFERSIGEVRWYPMISSFELVAKAERLACVQRIVEALLPECDITVRGRELPVMRSSASWGKEESMPLAGEELGDYHDNLFVLTLAHKELAQGHVWTARQRLLHLQKHIDMTGDKQSAVHLLPDVEKLLRQSAKPLTDCHRCSSGIKSPRFPVASPNPTFVAPAAK